MLSLSLLAASCLTAAPPPPSGTATVSLQDLLPLVSAPAPAAASPEPPVQALVVRSELKGHLALDALTVQAHFEVDVLGTHWVRLALLRAGPDVFATELPELENATVAVHDGALCLMSRTPGHYKLDVALAVRAKVVDGVRRAELMQGGDGLAVPLHLDSDSSVFTVVGAAPDVQDVYPREGRWDVAWRSAAPVASKARAAHPPLEPRITEADARWVSTLEGRATLRVHYALQLDRAQSLEVSIPEGLRVERVTVNGAPLAAEPKDGRLALEVSPASVGGSAGAVELALTQELGTFHLSGLLRLALPRASWPIAEVTADAYLPAVFNYSRQGGSLEQVESAATETSAELPGKALHFRQFLVAASSPSLDLGYSVDMSKSYFH